MSSTPVSPRFESYTSALFPEYRQRACRYAHWWLDNECDSEEVVQEAFVRLAQREQSGITVSGEKSFAGLLFTTVRNLCIDRLRKNGRRRDVPLTAVGEPLAPEANPTRLKQLDADIQRLIRDLPERWADALKLKMTGDLSYQEIAEVLKCTQAQVRTWIFRARQRLARQLEERGWMEGKV